MRNHSLLFAVSIITALLLLPVTALAYQGEWLIFPNLTGQHRNTDMAGHPRDTLEPTADTFFTASHERVRFLAEFELNRGESMLERLQVGWLPTPSNTIWVGRFHNPLGFWNTEFHHGNYLATAISRPGIIAFEEHGGGVLPMHVSGLLLEGATDSPVSYSLGLGVGPTIGMMGLMPVDLLNPTETHGRLSVSGRLTYRPSSERADEFGIFAAHTTIPGDNYSMDIGMGMMHTITEIKQMVAGAELNQEYGKLRLIGELYIVNNRVDSNLGKQSNTFASGYLQADYSIHRKWILFTRVEDSADTGGDPYLDLNPEFIKSRTLAGARYAFARNRALKLELSHNEYQDKTRSEQLAIEWSAVFP